MDRSPGPGAAAWQRGGAEAARRRQRRGGAAGQGARRRGRAPGHGPVGSGPGSATGPHQTKENKMKNEILLWERTSSSSDNPLDHAGD